MKKLSRLLPFPSFLGFFVSVAHVHGGEIANVPFEAGNWTPAKVHILLDNSESMRSEALVNKSDASNFPRPGVREGLVVQWDGLFLKDDATRLKFIEGQPILGVGTKNTSGTDVTSTQCEIINPLVNKLYFNPTDQYLRWNPNDVTGYGSYPNAPISSIPSWFKYNGCSKNTLGTLTAVQKQNAANWWRYYSTRSKYMQKVLSDAIMIAQPKMIFGITELNGPSAGLPDYVRTTPQFVIRPADSATNYYDNANDVFDVSKISAHNANVAKKILQRQDTQLVSGVETLKDSIGRTPLRTGLDEIGTYFKTPGNLDNACQRTFALVVTDGYWNEEYTGSIGDVDGDGNIATFADIAMNYYVNGFGAAGKITPNDWNPKTGQHMSTYAVSLGLDGNLTDNSCNKWPDATATSEKFALPPTVADKGSSLWGNPQTDKVGVTAVGIADKERIDDLWHAAYNSHGIFFNSAEPNLLGWDIALALSNIYEQSQSFESKDIISGVDINMESSQKLLYRASFNPSDWTGSILAYKLDNNGDYMPFDATNPTAFPAFAEDSDPQNKVFTYNYTATDGVDFQYANLDTSDQLVLIDDSSVFFRKKQCISNIVDAREKLVDWLKGDKTYENVPPYSFRERKPNRLGDIIHSKPLFMGTPNKYYKDRWASPRDMENRAKYSQFIANNRTRGKALFVGANDGYMHGFNAEPPFNRYFSYVPSFLFNGLAALAEPNYIHQYFVDGALVVDDVCYKTGPSSACEWHSVLVGSAGAGGQGVFALDVTNPTAMTSANVLWEFTDKHDKDLGFVLGAPTIARFRATTNPSVRTQPSASPADDIGQWLVVVSGGYNNIDHNNRIKSSWIAILAQVDDPLVTRSITGKSYLYLLNVKTGAIVKKFGIPGGTLLSPNGLGSPAVVDADGDNITDYIFVGDLKGNLWKIDVRSENPDDWTGGAGTNISLAASNAIFTTINGDKEPITVRPQVIAHPAHKKSITSPASGIVAAGTARVPDKHQFLIYFGTGKFFEVGDTNPKTLTHEQHLYALYDNGTNVAINIAKLRERTIAHRRSSEDFAGTDQLVRYVTPYGRAPGIPNGDMQFISTTSRLAPLGWYITLDKTVGERVVVDAVFRAAKNRNSQGAIVGSEKIFFNTMMPQAGGNCGVVDVDTVNGWAMVLDAYTGNNAYVVDETLTSGRGTGGLRLSKSAGFSNIKTQGFNNGLNTQDRVFLELKINSGRTDVIAFTPLNIGSSNSTHRETYLQLGD